MIAITTTAHNITTTHNFTTGADDFAGVESLADYDYATLREDGWIVTRTGNADGAAQVTAGRYEGMTLLDQIKVDYLVIG